MSSRGDQLVERAAGWLEQQSRKAAAEGGSKAKLADMLAEDAEFVRKLKPSLIAARARGELPTDEQPGTPRRASAPVSAPRPKPSRSKSGKGPNPFAVVGAALLAGIVLAKVIDWRAHAHPRD